MSRGNKIIVVVCVLFVRLVLEGFSGFSKFSIDGGKKVKTMSFVVKKSEIVEKNREVNNERNSEACY